MAPKAPPAGYLKEEGTLPRSSEVDLFLQELLLQEFLFQGILSSVFSKDQSPSCGCKSASWQDLDCLHSSFVHEISVFTVEWLKFSSI